MAITPNNYPFSGGAFMGGGGTPVERDDIHTLNITKGGVSLGNYNPLVGDADIDIPETSTTAVLPIKVDENGRVTNNGNLLTVTGNNAWAEGERTKATAARAHAEGYGTEAFGADSHAEGSNTKAGAAESHAEGAGTIASGQGAHAEGGSTHATGQYSHSEGYNTQATRLTSHAEGRDTEASHVCSHAEGYKSKASGESSHSEGENTEASGQGSHAEGGACVASGDYSHASGEGTRATDRGSTAVGRFNSDGTALFVVGDGVNPDEGGRSDAFKVDRFGRSYVKNEAGNLVKVRGAGIAIFTVSRSGGTYTYPDADDVIDAISNYDEVVLQVVSALEGTFNYAYDYSLIANEYRWIREDGSHVITLTGAGSPLVWTWGNSNRSLGGGSQLYATLQDAITDVASLNVGDYFETNGFRTSGDGGAARYLVSNTGTANGMDIVQLAAGKLAILQINQNREMYPEQFGYDRFASQNLTPVLERMVSQNVRNIRLLPCGSDNFPYLMTTGWTVNVPSVSIVGYSGLTTGYASRIWFKPDSYGADVTPMFSLTMRDFIMKNVVIMNRPWFTEGDKHNCVAVYMAVTNTNKMWYDFDNLAIQGFDIGIGKLIPSGEVSDGLIWHCEFHKLQMALNNKNVYLKGLSYVTKFDNCFFTVNDSGAQSIAIEESFTVEFDRCNFGIYSPADTVLKFNKFVVADRPVDERWSSAKFTNCNFEIESDDLHPLPTGNTGYFAKLDDDDDFHIEFDNCFFISTPLARANIYGCRAFSLGNKTSVKFTNCCGSYADVKYTGNEFYEWDFQKRMFDGTRPPKKEIGSVIIQHSMGIITPPNNQWGSIYLPTVKTDEMTCPQCDNDTDFLLNYPTSKDGLMLMNLDDAGVRTKMGNSLVQVVSPQSGKVRIGDRVYDYVVIDNRKWITTNLQLWTMNSRQWHFPDHPEFGFYYMTNTFAEIDALLPSGWRRPNYADCQSLISQGYAAIQGTGWTQWSSATNSSGFNAMPCGRWREPDITPDFTVAFLWGPEESGVGWHNIWIRPTQLTYGGWTYADAANLKIALRVCADA